MAAKEIVQLNTNLNFNWFATYQYVLHCSQFYHIILGTKAKKNVFIFISLNFILVLALTLLHFFHQVHSHIVYNCNTVTIFCSNISRFGFFSPLSFTASFFSYFILLYCCKLCYFIFLALKHLHVYPCGKYMSNVRLNVI